MTFNTEHRKGRHRERITRIVRIRKSGALLTMVLALFGFTITASGASAATGSFPTTAGALGINNVEWRNPHSSGWKFMAGDSPDGAGTGKDAVHLGTVTVVDYTSSHFPVTSAVSTINSYLAANSNMFRLKYRWNGSGGACANNEKPCIEVRETNDPMAVLGLATVSGGFCSLSTKNYVKMSWPNMQPYSTTARKGAVMHELYHTIGLPHSSNSNDLMYGAAGEPSAPTTGINRATPSAADSTNVTLLYGRWGTNAGYAC